MREKGRFTSWEMNIPDRSNKKLSLGFALIELLMVIAIIAILMAILMPVLRKSKYQAYRVVCTNNVRQQAVVFFMYADDHDGQFPMHCERVAALVKDDTEENYDGGCNIWRAFKDTYVTDSRILLCPILRKLGGVYTDLTCVGTGTRRFGGWDSPAEVISIAYNWYANWSPRLGNYHVDFHNEENPWPKNQFECSSRCTFITHEILVNNYGLYDHSHGGAYFTSTPNLNFDSSESIDNPLGFSDGHVIYRLKTRVLLRASYKADRGLAEYYY